MAESVIRLERKCGFTVLPTAMLRDPRLSLKTKGLFSVMISLPEGWTYSVSGLAVINNVGRDAIRSALKEMEAAGYLTRERAHGERGKFAGNVYTIREESSKPLPLPGNPAMGAPSSGFPAAGDPPSDNPTQSNIDQSSKDQVIPPKAPQGGRADADGKPKRRSAKSVPDWEPERFEAFWRYYPRHEDRVSAAREWDRLEPDDALIDAMARALKRQMASEDWRKGIGIPYACRWLRHRRWEDEKRPASGPGGTLAGEGVPVW